MQKKLKTFTKYFISFTLANYIFDYLVRPSNMDISRNVSVALGLALGITFFGNRMKNEKKTKGES